jgi:DNA-binding HxlR family transcriptional regulator
MSSEKRLSSHIDNACLTLEILRGRWKLLILRVLIDGPSRTGQMLRALDGVAKNRLNQNLKELERLGILSRKSFPGRVPRVEYFLTKRGHSLAPVIESLDRWGAENRALRRLKTGAR